MVAKTYPLIHLYKLVSQMYDTMLSAFLQDVSSKKSLKTQNAAL